MKFEVIRANHAHSHSSSCFLGPLNLCPIAVAAGLSSQAKHMAAVHENWRPPHPSPVRGSKYSRNPALFVNSIESCLIRSASSSYLHKQTRNVRSMYTLTTFSFSQPFPFLFLKQGTGGSCIYYSPEACFM